ncbi:MAG: LysR family transcriptional regulator [Alphaproteobacteria bacterium]
MDSLGALNAFVAAAEARSFVGAGRQLGVSASAIGKAVARLEERLGTRLFHRSTRSITLTPEGVLFLERCRRISGEVEAAVHELAHRQHTPRGKLRVSLPLVGMLLMPTITGFIRAYPEVELDLDFTDRLVDVVEEGFDAVVRTGTLSDSRLMTRVLGTFQHKLVGAPAYLAAHGVPQSPEDLVVHACLHHKYPSSGRLERWPLCRGDTDLQLDLPVTTVASTLEPLIYLAEQGMGIACLPLFTVYRQLEQGTLVSLLDSHLRDVGTFRVLWPSSRQLSPKLRAFVGFLAENLFSAPSR